LNNQRSDIKSQKQEIWAIILAGGESRRMKEPKMLLPYMGKTIIEKVVENVLSSDIGKILVVVGAYHDSIAGKISRLQVEYCFNENYKEGMLSSVICGFRSLPDNAEAAMVFQGDQPFIGPGTINKIIEGYRTTGKGIVIPVHDNKRGHPVLIDFRYKREIEKLSSDEGLRSLAGKFHDDVAEIEINAPEILRDIDTKEDYLREINITQ
jgi:molybdenum cofactor cytidylyltransferase